MNSLMLKQIETFTQKAYLHTAALKHDSKVIDSEKIAYIQCESSKERWLNAVSRCHYSPDQFNKIQELAIEYDSKNINFNWHLWPSSHIEMFDYLTNVLGLVFIGKAQVYTKDLTNLDTPVLNDGSSINLLKDTEMDNYIDAKMRAWENPPSLKNEIKDSLIFSRRDHRNKIFRLMDNSQIIAGASSFSDGKFAYLKGGFVVSAFRKSGYYQKLNQWRESFLKHSGVELLTVIADKETAGHIFKKMNYKFVCEITILARKKTPWVSL